MLLGVLGAVVSLFSLVHYANREEREKSEKGTESNASHRDTEPENNKVTEFATFCACVVSVGFSIAFFPWACVLAKWLIEQLD